MRKEQCLKNDDRENKSDTFKRELVKIYRESRFFSLFLHKFLTVKELKLFLVHNSKKKKKKIDIVLYLEFFSRERGIKYYMIK